MSETQTHPSPTGSAPAATISSIVVATDAGLRLLDDGSVEMADRRITDVTAAPDGPLALVDGSELLRRRDGEWRRVAVLDAGRGRRIGTFRGDVYVGGQEARLWRLAGDRFERVGAFDRAPTHDEWHTPWGAPPDIYSIASDGDHVFVGVHVGGIIRSTDGETWVDTIDLHDDVHQVTVDVDGVVWAATGMRALARSDDRGETWEYLSNGLHARYALAVAVGSAGPIVGVSSGPHAHDGRVYRWTGERFVRVEGLPDDLDGAVGPCKIVTSGDRAAIALPNGDVYDSADGGASWTPAGRALGQIHALAHLP